MKNTTYKGFTISHNPDWEDTLSDLLLDGASPEDAEREVLHLHGDVATPEAIRAEIERTYQIWAQCDAEQRSEARQMGLTT